MREWLIRWLGGIPKPDGGWLVIDDLGIELTFITKEGMLKVLGAVPLPKAGEGQYLRRPAACRKPVRKKAPADPPAAQALKDAIEAAGGEVHVTEMKVTKVNLCDSCEAQVQDCHKAVKETDESNNTMHCDKYFSVKHH
jgi:hypothetical protein